MGEEHGRTNRGWLRYRRISVDCFLFWEWSRGSCHPDDWRQSRQGRSRRIETPDEYDDHLNQHHNYYYDRDRAPDPRGGNHDEYNYDEYNYDEYDYDDQHDTRTGSELDCR